ncbi:MAG: hypothetical protein ACNA76_06885 [Anaerosomatales bacterium]
MRNVSRLLVLALVAMLALAGTANAWNPDLDGDGVADNPVLVDPWASGDAYFEAAQAGGCADFAYKVDDWDEDMGMDDTYTHAGNTIEVLNSDGETFDWKSEWPVCVVIVKAGTGAYLYYYPGGAYGDSGLVAPDDKDISHVTFGFNEPDNGWCAETAWAVGERYVKRGSWAMYVEYDGEEKTVKVLADGGSSDTIVGTATFSAPVDGHVTITIDLDGAIFYYDVDDDLEDNNLKVQDYAKVPKARNPRVGLFDSKTMVDIHSTTGSIVVPENNYYGVHMDLAVPCN